MTCGQHPVVAIDVNHGHLAAAVIAPDGNVLGAPATIASGPGRAAVRHPRRAPARRHQRPDRHREGPRRPRHRHRGPRLRRSPRRRTGTGGQPALARQARPGLPARRLRHPHREAPRPAGPDGRQRRAVGDRRRSRLHLPLGSRALAAALAGAPPEGDRSPRGSAGDRATRARAPGQAPRDREPTAPEEAARPAQARPRTTPPPGTAPRKPAAPPGPRQPPGTKTGRPHRTTAGNQAAQDRSGPPPRQDHVLLVQQERLCSGAR